MLQIPWCYYVCVALGRATAMGEGDTNGFSFVYTRKVFVYKTLKDKPFSSHELPGHNGLDLTIKDLPNHS